MKQIYISAWILLMSAAVFTILTGAFSPAALLVFSLAALALFCTLALWSVIVQTRDWQSE